MASLKDLRNRIASVKSTQKITSAMKMVAAAKLKRAQEQAEAARPYAERMERMLGSLAASLAGRAGVSPMLAGTGTDDVQLIVVMTSDRGLCGGFNTSIVRRARQLALQLRAEGKEVKFLCVGRKGRDQLRRDWRAAIVDDFTEIGRPTLEFADADKIADRITKMFEAGEFDVCTLIYNRFRSAISQVVTDQQLIPFAPPEQEAADPEEAGAGAVYEYEPEEAEILQALLPRNLAVQVFRGLLESSASEHGARMTAMDNATRNAGEMIGRLTLTYNRTRQAQITKELIEIISGAEAL
jgi:F-type H+-transporting ATPase subunit gamma